jgi:hypothetical protein
MKTLFIVYVDDCGMVFLKSFWTLKEAEDFVNTDPHELTAHIKELELPVR